MRISNSQAIFHKRFLKRFGSSFELHDESFEVRRLLIQSNVVRPLLLSPDLFEVRIWSYFDELSAFRQSILRDKSRNCDLTQRIRVEFHARLAQKFVRQLCFQDQLTPEKYLVDFS